MKKALALIVAVLVPMSSFAWVPQMYLSVTPNFVQVQVTNPTPGVALCQGFVYGQLQTGVVVNSWFNSYVPPYGFQYAYVYANGGYMFVNGWANINCQ
jgi:hypothetical protein